MKKSDFLRHPLTLIASFFLLFFLTLRFGPNIPLSVVSQQKGTPLVVEGTGKATAVPDIAKVFLSVEETGNTLSGLEKKVNDKSKNLANVLKKIGIGEKDIKTTSYNVSPTYDYRSGNPKITGYRVSTTYEVKVKNFDKINDVLAQATDAGATSVGTTSFEVNDETKNKLLTQAREEAVAEAKQKAESLAKAAGVSLGKVINISESQTPQPIPMKAMGLGGAPEVSRPEIQPGETEISVRISISWELR